MEYIFPVLYVMLLSMLSWQPSDACSCMKEHPQESFCKSDFVVKLRVVNSTELTQTIDNNVVEMMGPSVVSAIMFTVDIQKVFKMSGAKDNYTELITPPNSALCGLPLKIGEKYLISGQVIDGQLRSQYCNFWQQWDKMPVLERKTLGKFAKYCETRCKITTCWDRNGCRLQPDHCYMPPTYHYAYQCYWTHGVCMQKKNGKCKWLETKGFKKCYKQKKEEYFSEP